MTQTLKQALTNTPFVFEEIVTTDELHLEELARRFHLHRLTVEDLASANVRNKVEIFPGYIFFVWSYFSKQTRDPVELHFILTDGHIVVVSAQPPRHFRSWADLFFGRASQESGLVAGPRPHLLVDAFLSILDRLVDDAEEYLDVLSDEATDVEEMVIADRASPKRILALKRAARQFERTAGSSRELCRSLSLYFRFSHDEQLVFRSIVGHLARMEGELPQLKSQLAALFDVYWGVKSTIMNETMQRLTGLAFVFVPISAITGFFGMNFEAMPFKQKWFFNLGLGLIGASFVLCLGGLMRKGVFRRVYAEKRLREKDQI